MGIALDSNDNVFVSDRDNCKIEVYNSSGSFIRRFGSQGAGNDQFADRVGGLLIDSPDNLFATDSDGNIRKFNSNFEFVTRWGEAGSGNGQFANPSHITVDNNMNLYATDPGNTRIQVFAPAP